VAAVSLSLPLVGSELVDELLDAELSDEVLDDGVVELDVGDLDLGLLGDEVHLPLSLLQASKKKIKDEGWVDLPPPRA